MELVLSIWDILVWVLGFACKEFTWSCFRDSWIIPVFTTAIGAWVVYSISRIGKRAIEREKREKFDKGMEAYNQKDYSKAIQIWLPLADRSYEKANWIIKKLRYIQGKINKSWIGYAPAQFKLGKMYEDGVGFVKDYKKAKKWYEKGANQNHATSQAYLGYLYRRGLVVDKEYEKVALKLYKKSAKQGDAVGQNNLGFMYRNGKGGVEQSDKEAFEWYMKAADQGHARAQNNIGHMYSKNSKKLGLNITAKKAVKEAVRWYRQSAKQGDEVGQYNLARMYEDGKGVDLDNIQAYKWFYIADKNDDAPAKDKLNEVKKVMMKKGKAKADKDIEKAKKLAKRCIDSNYEDCGEPADT